MRDAEDFFKRGFTAQYFFDAVIENTAGTGSRVLERQSIVMIDSLFETRLLANAARARPLGFVALANDTRVKGDTATATVFSRLQWTTAEVNSIATLFQKRDPPAKTRLLLGNEGSAASMSFTSPRTVWPTCGSRWRPCCCCPHAMTPEALPT